MREESRRQKRVGRLIQEALSEILQQELAGVTTGVVTVTRAEVPADLRTARIYLSVFGPEDPTGVLAYLEKRKGHLRKLLASSVKLKYNPGLIFTLDETEEFSERMDELLRSTKARERDTS
jgi:ribosome-binding factor A